MQSDRIGKRLTEISDRATGNGDGGIDRNKHLNKLYSGRCLARPTLVHLD